MMLGHVYGLPSGATKHSIELGPYDDLNICSFFKEREQEIRISKYKVKNYTLKLKEHMFKLKITSNSCWGSPVHMPACHCSECHLKKHDKLDFYLYSNFTPYLLYNVDVYAHICFGNDLSRYPKDLKQANAAFWASPFNSDLGPYSFREQGSHKCNPSTRKHREKTHPGHTSWDRACRRKLKHTCNCEFKDFLIHEPGCACYIRCACKCSCECCLSKCSCVCRCKCCLNLPDCGCVCDCFEDEIFWVMQNRSGPTGYREAHAPDLETNEAHGVFISQNSNVLTKVNASFHKRLKSGSFCVVGFCIKVEDQWYIDISGKEEDILKLTSEEIRVA